MPYGQIIKQAFWIARHRPFLWFFGFFAGGASGGNFNVPTGGGGGGGNGGGGGDGGDFGAFLSDNASLIIAIVVVLLLIILAFIVLSPDLPRRPGGERRGDRPGEDRRFGTAWSAGVQNLGRVLLESLLFAAIGIGLLLAIGAPIGLVIFGTFAATESLGARIAVAILFGLAGFAVLLAAFFVFQIVYQFALRYVIVGRERVVAALRAAWRLFRGQLGTSLLIGLISFGLSLAGAFVLVAGALLIGFVLALPAIILGIAGYVTAAIAAGAFALVLFLAVFCPAAGALGTFTHAYWTLSYLRLTGTPSAPAATGPAPMTPPPAPA